MKLILCVLTVILATITHADSDMQNLKYVKIGTELGTGFRFHKNIHGADLSLNHSSFMGETWTGGRAVYLCYPFARLNRYFYLGGGTGIVYGTLDVEQSMAPLLSNGRGHVSIHKNRIYPTIETVMGYEFLSDTKVKLFTQFDLTIPVGSEPLPLFISGPGQAWKPALTLGVGF